VTHSLSVPLIHVVSVSDVARIVWHCQVIVAVATFGALKLYIILIIILIVVVVVLVVVVPLMQRLLVVVKKSIGLYINSLQTI